MKKGVREGNVFIYKVLQIILSFLFHFLFYFILILLIFSIFIKNYFSSKKVNFEIRKTEQEDEIEIQGLNEKDIEEIE